MNTNEVFCDVCEMFHAHGTSHPDRIHKGPRTQTVRIAVALFSGGRIGAQAVDDLYDTDEAAERNARKRVEDETCRVFFAELDVPLPEPAETIKARIVKGGV